MFRSSMRVVLVALVSPIGLLPLLAAGASAQSSDEEAIRGARAGSNAAIARHDAGEVAETFLDDVTVVTSTGSRETGKGENRAAFESIFRARPDVLYRREPEEVAVLAEWAVASERGRWKGTWTDADGAVEIGGTYLAQWRKVNGRWLIQSELFVPVACRGGQYCRQHP
jgi:uncharacterized protein (TIGR02246 family)